MDPETEFPILNLCKNSTLTLSLQGQSISQTADCKYLGITLDNALNFSKHIQNIISRINQNLGILRYVSKFVLSDTLISLYNSFIFPHYDYCATIWSVTIDTNLTKLQKL